jgi:phage terminase large subunit-like protein
MSFHARDVANMSEADRAAFLASLTPDEAEDVQYDWEHWARPEQRLPDGNWINWLILAGRGMGKTRIGSETVRQWVKRYRYVNLIGATADDVRTIMVEGESGILAICPPDERPKYIANKRELHWPNGNKSLLFSAEEPDRLRGKQHEKLWCDERAAWRYPDAWDQAAFGLRLGDKPQTVITTTPRPTPIIKGLIKDSQGENAKTFITRGSTFDNIANLADSFIHAIVKKYEGTRLGRQELNAEILDDTPGALWTRAMIERAFISADVEKVRATGVVRPGVKLTSIIVSIDPATTSGEDSNETGIVVVGRGSDGHGYVLEDAWPSIQSPARSGPGKPSSSIGRGTRTRSSPRPTRAAT